MKKVLFILTFAVIFLAGLETIAQKSKVDVVCFKSSMHCGSCEKTLFDLLRFENGVKDLELDYVSNTIKVVYITKKTSPEKLSGNIKAKGYESEKISAEDYLKLRKAAGKE